MVRQAHHEAFDRLTMRPKTLKLLNLILSLSKDEAWSPAFFSVSLVSCDRLFWQEAHQMLTQLCNL